MKVTINIPDGAKVMTYQVVYDEEHDLNMKIKQWVLDTNALEAIRAKESTDD